MKFVRNVGRCVFDIAQVVVAYTVLVCLTFVLHYIVRLDP